MAMQATCFKPSTRRAPRQSTRHAVKVRATAAPQKPSTLIELREYTLKPEKISEFMALSGEVSELRATILPFLGMFKCDMGGVINRVTHFYSYADCNERVACGIKGIKNPDWQKYTNAVLPLISHQENRLLEEATELHESLGLGSAGKYQSPASPTGRPFMYELRNYQLKPGYNMVPQLLQTLQKGLPHKIKAGEGFGGNLVFVGHTDLGMANNVVELWRYPSSQACIDARKAARQSAKWRDSIIAGSSVVDTFQSQLLMPCAFSPWK